MVEIQIWGGSKVNSEMYSPQIIVPDVHTIWEKLRSTVCESLKMVIEGILTDSIVSGQRRPGHLWLESLRNIVQRVVYSVLGTVLGIAQGLSNYQHIILIWVLKKICFPQKTWAVKGDLASYVARFQGGPGNRCVVCSECTGIHPCFAYRPPSVWCTLPSKSFLNCFVNKAATTAATVGFGLLPAWNLSLP